MTYKNKCDLYSVLNYSVNLSIEDLKFFFLIFSVDWMFFIPIKFKKNK